MCYLIVLLCVFLCGVVNPMSFVTQMALQSGTNWQSIRTIILCLVSIPDYPLSRSSGFQFFDTFFSTRGRTPICCWNWRNAFCPFSFGFSCSEHSKGIKNKNKNTQVTASLAHFSTVWACRTRWPKIPMTPQHREYKTVCNVIACAFKRNKLNMRLSCPSAKSKTFKQLVSDSLDRVGGYEH